MCRQARSLLCIVPCCTSTGFYHHTYGEQWGCPGNKGRSHREQSASSSSPNRCPSRAVAPAHARAWIADSEHVLLLFEPGRYPVAYFPETDVSPHTLERTDHTTQHPDLGLTSWYRVRAGEHAAPRGA